MLIEVGSAFGLIPLIRHLRVDLLNDIQEFLNRANIAQEDRILVAVSGGIDSMVLADCLHRLNRVVIVAHVHHGMRLESDEELDFVSGWCEARNIPFRSIKLDPEEKPNGANFQDWARDQRYKFFRKEAKLNGCVAIATAHHFGDKVETFLGHSVRGSGLSGLTSLREIEGQVIRPLSAVTREMINQYAKDMHIEWREDTSNDSDDYQRNRIRHHVISSLDSVSKHWQKGMSKTLANLTGELQLLDELILNWKKKHVKEVGDQIYISIDAIGQSASRPSLLFHLLKHVDAEFDWQALSNCDNDQIGSFYFGRTHRALRDRHELVIEPISNNEQNGIDIYEDSTEIEEPISISFQVVEYDEHTDLKAGIANQSETFSSKDALLDLDKLQFPLTIRKWQSGDKFMPLGMKGMKLISDYLIDAKVSRLAKEQTWVLLNNDQVVWLIGHRIDERFKVGEDTQKMYLARLERD